MAVSTATEKLILRMGPSVARPVMDVGEPFFDTDTETFGVGNGTTTPPLALSASGRQTLTNKTWVDQLPTASFAAGTNTYTVTVDNPYLTANRDGLIVRFVIPAPNTGPVKLVINSFASVDLVTNKGAALTSGQLTADQIIEAIYKNGVFRILNMGDGSTSQVSSSGTSSNVFSIGDGTSASVKRLVAQIAGVNKPFVQYNPDTNSWEFSNDGISTAMFGAQVMGGLFDNTMTGTVFYTATTSAAPAWTAPSTTGHRYLVRSILATNIAASDATVNAEVTYATGGDAIAYGWNLLVPVGMSVELLRKPKVFQPGDILSIKASLANTVQITITYADVSDTSLFGVGVDMTTTTMVDVRIAGSTKPDVIESILVANDDGTNPVDVSIAITDASNAIKGYLVYQFTVDAKSSVEVLDAPKFLPAGWKLRAQTATANRAEITVTGRTKS